MTLWVCKKDRVKYSVGAPGCPECGTTEYWEEGEVPKITKAGNVSHEGVIPEHDAALRPDEQNDNETSDARRRRDKEGGEQASHGNSSSTSESKPETKQLTGEPKGQSPAPTTESHSSKTPTVSSGVPQTGGAPRTTPSGTETKKVEGK